MTFTPDPSQPTSSIPPAAPPAAPVAPAMYAAPAYPMAATTNTLAIVALVLAILIGLPGAICGHVALNQIKRTGEGGRGLALAGVIIGWVFTAFSLIWFIIVVSALGNI